MMEVSGPASHPGHSTLGEGAPGAYCTESWVGPKASVDTVLKRDIHASAKNHTLVIQAVA